MTTEENSNVTATIKFGKGFDAPWLVFRGKDSSEVQALVESAMDSELFAVMKKATSVASTLMEEASKSVAFKAKPKAKEVKDVGSSKSATEKAPPAKEEEVTPEVVTSEVTSEKDVVDFTKIDLMKVDKDEVPALIDKMPRDVVLKSFAKYKDQFTDRPDLKSSLLARFSSFSTK